MAFSPRIKSQAALDAMNRSLKINDLAKKYNASPNQIMSWRKKLIDGADQIFTESEINSDLIKSLYTKIGTLVMERDLLMEEIQRLKLNGV